MKTKISILILALGVGLVGCQSKEEKLRERMVNSFKKGKEKVNEEKKLEAEKKASEKARGVILIEDIYSEFEANQVRCKSKYHLKDMKVKGKIEEITDSHVDFSGDGLFKGSISAIAKNDVNGKNIIDFNKGDEIVIEGKIVFLERVKGIMEIVILCTEGSIKEYETLMKWSN